MADPFDRLRQHLSRLEQQFIDENNALRKQLEQKDMLVKNLKTTIKELRKKLGIHPGIHPKSATVPRKSLEHGPKRKKGKSADTSHKPKQEDFMKMALAAENRKQ